MTRSIDMVVFDIDGTLIVHPTGKVVWQHLCHRFGTPIEVNHARLKQHVSGELSYADWVRLDIEDWQRAGARRSQVVDALREFRLREGARAALSELQRRGYRLAAVSGTLDILVETVFPDHPFERIFSNRIFFDDDGAISGWEATPFDFDGKATALRELASDGTVSLERMAFVGDDINDVDAAKAVGFSVAHHPRSEELAACCDLIIREGSLEQLLEYLP